MNNNFIKLWMMTKGRWTIESLLTFLIGVYTTWVSLQKTITIESLTLLCILSASYAGIYSSKSFNNRQELMIKGRMSDLLQIVQKLKKEADVVKKRLDSDESDRILESKERN